MSRIDIREPYWHALRQSRQDECAAYPDRRDTLRSDRRESPRRSSRDSVRATQSASRPCATLVAHDGATVRIRMSSGCSWGTGTASETLRMAARCNAELCHRSRQGHRAPEASVEPESCCERPSSIRFRPRQRRARGASPSDCLGNPMSLTIVGADPPDSHQICMRKFAACLAGRLTPLLGGTAAFWVGPMARRRRALTLEHSPRERSRHRRRSSTGSWRRVSGRSN